MARASKNAPLPGPSDDATIVGVHAREILDSRGNPTVEAEVALACGAIGRAAVPSGASTGKHEAVELRDGTKAYGGLGVMKAVANINVAISKKIRGLNAANQEALDEAMLSLDGTNDKSRLGANALLAVSIAASRAVATARHQQYFEYLCTLTGQAPILPLPFANVINGGKHAAGKLKPQEFMVVPTGARTFAEAVEMTAETYHALQSLLKEKYGAVATHVGDEGGFAPPLDTAEEALDLLLAAIKKAGHKDADDDRPRPCSERALQGWRVRSRPGAAHARAARQILDGSRGEVPDHLARRPVRTG